MLSETSILFSTMLNESLESLDSSNLSYSHEFQDFQEGFIIQWKKISDVVHAILIYYSIFIIVAGSLFNLINFICFYRMKKRNSQNVYLSAFSLADLFNIQINIFLPLLKSMYPVINQKINELKWKKFVCTLDGYLVEVGLLLPVWFMVVLAFERFLCIMWPLRKNNFATPRHAKKVLFILTGIILLWSTYKITTAGIENQSTFYVRSSSEWQDHICRNITNPILVNISTFMWAIMPVLLCLILNILIINRIKVTTSSHKVIFLISSNCAFFISIVE